MPETVEVIAFGSFETTQDEISARSRLTYVTGRQPKITNLTGAPKISAGKSICPCFGVAITTEPTPHLRGKANITLVAQDMESPDVARSAQALSTTQAFNTLIYLSGKDKSEWIRQFGSGSHI